MDNKVSNEEIVNDIIKELNINDTSEEDKGKVENGDSKTTSEADKNIYSDNLEPGNSTSKDFIPEDFEACNNESVIEIADIDDETLQKIEESLSDIDKEKNKQQALDLKLKGNEEFKNGNFLDSVNLYTKALNICPLSCKNERSIFYCNRAAAKMKLNRNETAIEDCTKAIEYNPSYLRAYLRRAKLNEATDKLDDSLKDFTKILELDPSHHEARAATIRLPPVINERNEKLKEEMLGKLKDLGNMILRPFGLSTENFQMQQDPNTGGYSVNFQQNRKS